MSWLVAAIAASLAFVFALVDSALLHAAFLHGAEPPPPRRETQHRALAFARVLAQLAAGAASAVALEAHTLAGWQLTLVIVGLGFGLVALTETAARELGDALADRVAPLAPTVARLAELLLAPVVLLGVRLDEALLRALPPQAPTEVSREETAEQFREIVAAEAEVTEPERALLAGVFGLGDTQVNEIMVPRVDVLGVERETPWSEVVDRVRSAEHSRLPVYDETIDDIVGVLYAKDVLPAIVAGEEPAGGWARLVRAASFIPETKRVGDQLRDFRASGNHMAVVVDEYGGTAGIVTIEDVLEEIVGEIRDERDDEEAPIVAEAGRRFWVSARVTLDELSEATGHDFAHDDVGTLGGLVYHELGRVPRAGERLELGPFRAVVERVVRRKIQRVYLERLAEPEAAGDAASGVAADDGGREATGDDGRDVARDVARDAARELRTTPLDGVRAASRADVARSEVARADARTDARADARTGGRADLRPDAR